MAEILVLGEETRAPDREVCQVADEVARVLGWRWSRWSLPAGDDAAAAAAAAEARTRLAGAAFCAATDFGKDFMARLAGLLRVPLAQDCISFEAGNSGVIFMRALHGGKVLADVRMEATPLLATLRPRTQRAFAGAAPEAAVLAPLVQVRGKVEVIRQRTAHGGLLSVAEAGIVISGGRGMQGPEHWHILEDLASVLGPRVALACSRPVSDSGWRPRAEHVGQTGRAIAPDVYIACGISGAIQHVAGIAGAQCIIAINRDAEAPIFKVADYGIVGDLFEVVPALTRAVRSVLVQE